MVWPALILEQRILSVVPIGVGLIIEWLALSLGGFDLSWRRAAVVDLVMNTVSTAVGVVLTPALGFAWEIFPGSLLYKAFHVGTFNPGTWAATFVIAALATTLIEAAVMKWGFKIRIDRRRFLVLCAANSASIALAFSSLWIRPPRM